VGFKTLYNFGSIVEVTAVVGHSILLDRLGHIHEIELSLKFTEFTPCLCMAYFFLTDDNWDIIDIDRQLWTISLA